MKKQKKAEFIVTVINKPSKEAIQDFTKQMLWAYIN